MSLFDLFIYCVVITNIFCQTDRLEPSFTYSEFCFGFCFHFRDFVSGFQIPDSGFRIPCFSAPVFKSLDFLSRWNLTLQVLAPTPPLPGGNCLKFCTSMGESKSFFPPVNRRLLEKGKGVAGFSIEVNSPGAYMYPAFFGILRWVEEGGEAERGV